MTPSDLNEEQLVIELRLGSTRAFGLIYERYKDSLCNYCSSLVKNNDVAEDIVHEIFLKMWNNIQTLNEVRSFRTWLFSIARNQALLFLRDRKPFEELSEGLPREEESPLDLLVNEEQSAMMGSLLNRLRPAYRELMLLRIEGELSYADIAAVTGMSQSAVRTHLYRARKALAKVYAELYGGKNGR